MFCCTYLISQRHWKQWCPANQIKVFCQFSTISLRHKMHVNTAVHVCCFAFYFPIMNLFIKKSSFAIKRHSLKLTFLLEEIRLPGSGYVYFGMALKNHAPVLFHSWSKRN